MLLGDSVRSLASQSTQNSALYITSALVTFSNSQYLPTILEIVVELFALEGAQRCLLGITLHSPTTQHLKVVLCVLSWKSSTALSTLNRASSYLRGMEMPHFTSIATPLLLRLVLTYLYHPCSLVLGFVNSQRNSN